MHTYDAWNKCVSKAEMVKLVTACTDVGYSRQWETCCLDQPTLEQYSAAVRPDPTLYTNT